MLLLLMGGGFLFCVCPFCSMMYVGVSSWYMLRHLGGSLCLGRYLRVIWSRLWVLGVLGALLGKYVDGVVLRLYFL